MPRGIKSVNDINKARIDALPDDNPVKDLLYCAQVHHVGTIELAKMLGVDYSTVTRWVNGRNVPRKREIQEKVKEVNRALRWYVDKEWMKGRDITVPEVRHVSEEEMRAALGEVTTALTNNEQR